MKNEKKKSRKSDSGKIDRQAKKLSRVASTNK